MYWRRVCVGTAFSGYAFSFTHESATSSSPSSRSSFNGGSSIHMMGKWEGSDPGIINQKTPSTLLLTPQGQFHSFGFTARNFYHDLTSDEARDWLYFDKFKMALYRSAVTAFLTWLGSVVVGRRTSDRKIASSTPGRCIAVYSLGQLSLPSLRGR